MLGTGVVIKDAGNAIKYQYYERGHTLHAFGLSSGLLNGDEQFELVMSGGLCLAL